MIPSPKDVSNNGRYRDRPNFSDHKLENVDDVIVMSRQEYDRRVKQMSDTFGRTHQLMMMCGIHLGAGIIVFILEQSAFPAILFLSCSALFYWFAGYILDHKNRDKSIKKVNKK